MGNATESHKQETIPQEKESYNTGSQHESSKVHVDYKTKDSYLLNPTTPIKVNLE